MSERLRLGFLCSEFPPEPHGGIGSFVYDIAHGMAARGHYIKILGLSERFGNSRDGRLIIQRIKPPSTHLGRRADAIAARVAAAEAMRQLAHRARLQLVEMPDWKGEGAFLVRTLRGMCPVVVRYHGSTTALERLRGGNATLMTRFFESQTLASADARITVSNFIESATRDVFPSVPAADETIPNFVNLDSMQPLHWVARDPNLILYVGRFAKHKGAAKVIEAMAEVLRQRPAAKALIVGEDLNEGPGGTPLLDELLKSVEAPIRDRIRSMGRQPKADLARVYSRGLCVLMPSRAEAFGLVALEAMACECVPVVAPNSGPAEFIRHGETGLVAGSEEVPAFVREITGLMDDHRRRDEIASAGRHAVVEQFSMESLLDRNERFYRMAIDRGSKFDQRRQSSGFNRRPGTP